MTRKPANKPKAVEGRAPQLVGYARVSTADQNLNMQLDALKAAGVETIFAEKVSGATADRPAFAKLREFIGNGDTVVFYSLSRAARSVRQLIDLAKEVEDKGANLKSLTEAIDTTTPGGRVVFHVIAAMAEYEREIIRERVKTGMESAKRHGVTMGRPSKMTPLRTDEARRLLAEGQSWTAVCRILGVGRATLSDALKRHPIKSESS